ncbi:cytochrome and DOMON domain-containing protein knickkopf [Oratosquilla oratoria]|uniref:cytochrome and DOMON domain-containing protein knickkopf n=1 Tax=Oratosquilla oratoria TaxID=337810 RepID=UPI003F76377A
MEGRKRTSVAQFLVLLGCVSLCWARSEDGGKLIGKLNSYHHQVEGTVYAVDEYTFLIKGFMYDGNGIDTFFWAGTTPNVGPQGFIVPNEDGRTNVLRRYLNEDITLRLPERKLLTKVRWLAIYDLSRLESFGDVTIPEGFEPPQKIVLNKMSSKSTAIQTGRVVIHDTKTIVIEDFNYDGTGEEVYFWVGIGPQAHSKGTKIPDEHGYMTPLRKYKKKRVELELPGVMTVNTIDWLAVYDIKRQEVLGSIIVPEDLNVPPSLIKIIHHESGLPNCEQLHKELQLSWDVFGDQVTLELTGRVGEDDYIAFGMSGSETEPKMEGADVVVAYMEGFLGYIVDYNISSYMPCTELLGTHKGVCSDDLFGGYQDYQMHKATRDNGINSFTFRRRLKTPDTGDTPYPASGPAQTVWAMGHLDLLKRPTIHYAWSKVSQPIEFVKKKGEKNCFAFTKSNLKDLKPWGPFVLADPAMREFEARLGPDGGPRGYEGITSGDPMTGLAWYINGYLTPDIYIRRNTEYRFKVEGGSSPYNPTTYHPLIITDEPHGGYSQLTEDQKKSVRVLAGIEYTRRGDSRPSAAGRLCLWKHMPEVDRRRDAEFTSFVRFRNSLDMQCSDGEPATLVVKANKSWPDVVYYNSWTGQNMGWRIHILDEVDPEKILEQVKGGQVRWRADGTLVFFLFTLYSIFMTTLLL